MTFIIAFLIALVIFIAVYMICYIAGYAYESGKLAAHEAAEKKINIRK